MDKAFKGMAVSLWVCAWLPFIPVIALFWPIGYLAEQLGVDFGPDDDGEAEPADADEEEDNGPVIARCETCGWPLKERIEDGCTAESCSERSR